MGSPIDSSSIVGIGRALRAGLSSRLDGWANTVTGIGTSRWKQAAYSFVEATDLSDAQLEALYNSSDLAARIVEAIPEDAMRKGFDVAGDPDGELMARARDLGVGSKVTEAWTWGRLFGGACIILGFADRRQDLPLNDDNVREGSLRYLLVVDKRELEPETWITDVADPNFGEVETYRVRPYFVGGQTTSVHETIVHSSRVIRFGGVPTTNRRRQARQGWEDSVLRRVCEALRDTESIWQSGVHVMQDLSQAVYKVKGLAEMVGAGQKDKIQELLWETDFRRNALRSLIMDAEHEDFHTIGSQNAGVVPTMVDKSWQRLAAAAEMPVTRLMGMSPAGMNATGESDARFWYDTVATEQERVAKPALRRLMRIIARSDFPGMDVDEIEVTFPSLWETTEAEAAALRNQQAQTDVAYINAGVLLAEEVAISRFGQGEWSPETEINADLREQLKAIEEEALIERAEQPDPVPPPSPFGQVGEENAEDEPADGDEPSEDDEDEEA